MNSTRVKKFFLAIVCGLFCLTALAAEVMPPAPAQYFNDYAHVVSAATAAKLNQQLEQFERDSSCQVVVAVFPKMPSDSSIEDYTVRLFNSWKIGQKDKNNGAVLFVFVQDHKMFLNTGYGLEGALPDALCKRIIADEITPSFKAGNFDAGLTAGVNAILAATKGEYKGSGQTVTESNNSPQTGNRPYADLAPAIIFMAIFFIITLLGVFGRRGGFVYTGVGSFNSGNSWSGGGFSGGGGSSGGGGAGGSW